MSRITQTFIIVLGVGLAGAAAWAVYRTLDGPDGPGPKQFKIRDAASGAGVARPPQDPPPPLTPPVPQGSRTQKDDPPPALPAGLLAPPVPDSRYLHSRFGAKAVSESSGIVASRRHPGVLWTHNDSGNDAELFAVDKDGKLLARYEVDEENIDWEAIAVDDDGHLYIGDIGNNNESRKHGFVYRLDEPDPHQGTRDGGGDKLKVTAAWKLKYPGGKDGRFDSEAMFVWKGKGYVISKLLTLQRATIYAFDLDPQRQPGSKKRRNGDEEDDARDTVTLQPLAEIPIRYPVTAADISPDGSRLAVLTVAGPYVMRIDGDVVNAARSRPVHVPYINPKEEAICFIPEGVLVTTEDRDILLFPDKLFEGTTLPGVSPATKPATRPAS